MYASASENDPARSIQIKLSACAAAKCVNTMRHMGALPSGVNRQIYPASTGISSEIMASGTPRKMLAVHESCPSVLSAGISTMATGIQVYLLTRPKVDFVRSAELFISASIADLHSSKHRHAHHHQSFFRLVRLEGGVGASRIGLPAEQ